MDNLTVDLGGVPDAHALRESEAVLIGERGERRITTEEIARRIGTINYEVTCGLTGRVPRVYHRDGESVGMSARESGSDHAGDPVGEGVGESQVPRAGVGP
jgi:alanine racemase